MSMRVKALLAVLLLVIAYLAIEGFKRHEQAIGEARGAARVQAAWDAEKIRAHAEALREHEAKAKEGLRRLERQEENQRAQDAEIDRLREAVARNAADADRVREQSARAASEWAARLADSPTREDLEAAGAAIAVCADVRGRLDQAAGILAAYAGAAAAAGGKCEADYDALTKVSPRMLHR